MAGAERVQLLRSASRKAEVESGGARWITLADPEGNEFDVIAEG